MLNALKYDKPNTNYSLICVRIKIYRLCGYKFFKWNIPCRL